MLHMIIEQTYKYPMRMEYDAETGKFIESEYKSLQYVRNFTKPYGWIKESGTPPFPHWDCILMTDTECNLGDEMDELKKLYPRISEGEGWFGKDVAEYCMKNYEKSL